MYAINKAGYIVPIKLRLKLDLLNNELGVTGLVEKYNEGGFEIMLALPNGEITNYTQNLYKDIF